MSDLAQAIEQVTAAGGLVLFPAEPDDGDVYVNEIDIWCKTQPESPYWRERVFPSGRRSWRSPNSSSFIASHQGTIHEQQSMNL